MTALAPVAGKIAKLIPRLATNHDGEVVATVRALERTLKSVGCDWHDLASALASPREPIIIVVERERTPRSSPGRATWADLLAMASELDGCPDLSPWEDSFVANVRRTLRRGYPLSAKQRRTLERIWQRVGDEAAA